MSIDNATVKSSAEKVVKELTQILESVVKEREKQNPETVQTKHVQRERLEAIFLQQVLALWFNHLYEMGVSDGKDIDKESKLPKEAYMPYDGKDTGWSMSMKDFILSVMAYDIGWDTDKYGNVAAWEKECRHREAYRKNERTREVLVEDKNQYLKQAEKNKLDLDEGYSKDGRPINMEYAYAFIKTESERFRKHLDNEFKNNYYYQIKKDSNYKYRWEKNKTNLSKYSSIPQSEYLKAPRLFPYHNWFIYAVRYLDSSPVLPEKKVTDDLEPDYGKMRMNRLWRFISCTDPSYTEEDVLNIIEHLHALRYPKSREGKILTYSFDVYDRAIKDRKWWEEVNVKIVSHYTMYPAFHRYLIKNSNDDSWQSKTKAEYNEESKENICQMAKTLSELEELEKSDSSEDFKELVDNKRYEVIYSLFGYRDLYRRIASIPQKGYEISNSIFSCFTLPEVDEFGACIAQLNTWFTTWCGGLYQEYLIRVTEEFKWEKLNFKIINAAMEIIENKYFEK